MELPCALASLLRFPLCGERRVVYCYVHAVKDFIERAKDWLGSRADVRPSPELVDEGWVGPGAAPPPISERIRHVAPGMRRPYTVKDSISGQPRHLHIG